MADEEQAIEQEEKQPKKKKSKAPLYIAVIAVQLLVVGYLVYAFIMPEYDEINALKSQINGEDVADDAEEEGEPKELGLMYKIENMTVNPRGTRGMRYAVFEFSLEVPSEEEMAELARYHTVLVDNYIHYFRNQTMTNLSNDAYMDSLKSQITEIANGILGREIVQNVYFTRYVLE